ncbi:Aspartic peptidase domain containing protein [Amanita muscaria]
MKPVAVLYALLFTPLLCAAHRLPLKRFKAPSPLQRRDAQANTLNLTSAEDLIYLVPITVGGQDYPVQLDTGSSDLWIKNNNSSPLPNVTRTTKTSNVTYAVGWAAGFISYAPVTFVGLSIPQQAFLEATQVNNPAIGYGARGIAGLGFTSLSYVDAEGNKTQSNADRSLLYNLFQVHPTQPNFFGFMLKRNDSQATEEGSFSIGEYEPGYEDIANCSKIPTWPPQSPKRWTVLLDAIIVGSQITVPSTTVSQAPVNKAVVLMDSGASYTYAPRAAVDAIYGNVTGAYFDNSLGQYVVPCSTEINMALQIGGQIFPIHPLDITTLMPGDVSRCVGSFIPGTFATSIGDFDWLIGDNALRSVYAIYDFGDFDGNGGVGDPYMKMLPTVDPDQASIQFHNQRGGQPETNITFVGLTGSSLEPVISASLNSSTFQNLDKFIPIMLGLIGLNTLILVILAIAGIVYVCKRRSRRNVRARPNRGRDNLSPMPMNPMNPTNSYVSSFEPPQPPPHRYEPVSMALTEDTLFAPPSPGFRKFDSGAGPSGDRPKSVA